MPYDIAETFYSIQGEGEWAGSAAFFIRLAGCNLKCEFCDTDYSKKKEMDVDELVLESLMNPARRVIITGGEPTLQDLQPLVVKLQRTGFKVHLETNGILPIYMNWDWIAVSPKSPIKGLNRMTILSANEIKFLCGGPDWEKYIEEFAAEFRGYRISVKWIMPLAKAWPFQHANGLLDHNIRQAADFCLKYPEFKLCLQQHKIAGVR